MAIPLEIYQMQRMEEVWQAVKSIGLLKAPGLDVCTTGMSVLI